MMAAPSETKRPCDGATAQVEQVRLRAELALLAMLDSGFGYADPRLPAETYLRDDQARERVFRAGMKPKGLHTEAAEKAADAIVQAEKQASAWTELDELALRFGLSPAERALLLVVCAYELDRDVQSLCHAIAGRRAPHLYADSCAQLHPALESPADRILSLSEASPLRFLVHCDHRPSDPLRLTPLARQWLVGDTRLPSTLGPWISMLGDDDAIELGTGEAEKLQSIAEHGSDPTLVLLQGPQGAGKRSFALHLARRVGRQVLSTGVTQLENNGQPLLQSVQELLVRCRAFDYAVYLAGLETISDRKDLARLLSLLGEGPGLVLLGTRRLGPPRIEDHPHHHVTLDRPNLEARIAHWTHELERVDATADATDLAQRFVVGPSDIRAACDDARKFSALATGGVEQRDIEAALSRQLSLDLGTFATRINRRALWGEMVVPEDVESTLHDMVTMVRERSQILEEWGYARHLGLSRGVAALFSGAPGTGKTMAASVISGELGLELFRIDLSQVVSKWVGETEKHLAKIFDEAQNAHAMLLFDEADSLFGKRTEVKSASDRYANLEVNYILQRMEQFDGVSILTTNQETALDTAFMRRLNFRVRFPEPDAEERKRLWTTLVPPETGLKDAPELAELASRFEMTGGHIRNAIVRAAVVAARDGRTLTPADLETGAISEYYELGKVVSSH